MYTSVRVILNEQQFEEIQQLRKQYLKEGFDGGLGDFILFILQSYGMVSYDDSEPIKEVSY